MAVSYNPIRRWEDEDGELHVGGYYLPQNTPKCVTLCGILLKTNFISPPGYPEITCAECRKEMHELLDLEMGIPEVRDGKQVD